MLNWIGSIIAISLYFPLIYGIMKGKIEQNFATWMLWVMLDAIVLGSVVMQKGNFLLLVFYCIGGTLVCFSLFYMRMIRWTRFETFVLSLVVICLMVWSMVGSYWTTIVSTIAVFVSGAPQIKDSFKEPDRKTGFIYLGYFFANIFSFFATKSWTIQDKFYPGMCAILCSIISFVAFGKRKVVCHDLEKA